MKYSLFAFCLSFTLLTNAQSPTKKLSSDSVIYYQSQLNKLWKNTFDSLRNSERYKELENKIALNNRQKNITIELLANIGLYYCNFQNLNTRLKSVNQQEVKEMTPSIGASLAVSYPIMTYGLELSSYVFDNSTASFKGVHGRLFIATNLFKKGRIALNPQVGFSGSMLNMFIHRSAAQTNFNDLFTGQANTINLTHNQNYLDFGLGLKLKSATKTPFYWQFLRLGYRYGLKDEAWKMRGGNIINAPTDRNNQFYIQFCLGFDR